MECSSISRDPASESIADIKRVFSLEPVRPKLDFPRSIFEKSRENQAISREMVRFIRLDQIFNTERRSVLFLL